MCGSGYRRSSTSGCLSSEPRVPRGGQKSWSPPHKVGQVPGLTQAVTVAATPSQVLLGVLSSLEILRS